MVLLAVAIAIAVADCESWEEVLVLVLGGTVTPVVPRPLGTVVGLYT